MLYISVTPTEGSLVGHTFADSSEELTLEQKLFWSRLSSESKLL